MFDPEEFKRKMWEAMNAPPDEPIWLVSHKVPEYKETRIEHGSGECNSRAMSFDKKREIWADGLDLPN